MDRTARKRLLASLLVETPMSSQAELVESLARVGHEVSQATVSRDLKALGAVKSPTGVYVLVGRVPTPETEEQAARALGEYAGLIAASGNLVLIRTPAGAAQVVAAAIDGAALPGVLGTVAGDDTLLVVADEEVGGLRVKERLEEMGATR